MESRFLRIFLKAGLALVMAVCLPVTAVLAQEESQSTQVIDPDVARRDIERADIDTENWEIGAFVGMISIEDFETKFLYGLTGNYHVNEWFFGQLNYGRAKAGDTSFERLSGSSPILTSSDRDYNYYDISLGWNALPGEAFVGRSRVYNQALYLIAGVGSTDFAGDNSFTINYGFGYRLSLTDAIAMHLNFRDYMFDMDILGIDKTTHNFVYSLGGTWFF
jgi:outer membrane beta-barrel protein